MELSKVWPKKESSARGIGGEVMGKEKLDRWNPPCTHVRRDRKLRRKVFIRGEKFGTRTKNSDGNTS